MLDEHEELLNYEMKYLHFSRSGGLSESGGRINRQAHALEKLHFSMNWYNDSDRLVPIKRFPE